MSAYAGPSSRSMQGQERTQERDPLLPTTSSNGKRTSKKDISRTQKAVWSIAALLIAVITIIGVVESIRSANKNGATGGKFTFGRIKLPGPQPGLRNPSYMARGRNGAVAAEVGECSDVGIDVLRDGGNAVDAAISACLCIGVRNMFASGIGGGGFMVIKTPSGEATSIDFRETAPLKSTPDMFVNGSSLFGGLGVGVPGELRGLEAAYKLYGGKVSWKRLFEPNIKMAESHIVGRELPRRLKIPIFSDFMKTRPEWARMFTKNGRFLEAGDTIYRPALAQTLRTVAEKGVDAFYLGPIAQSIVKTVQANGGILTMADMKNYKAVVQPAVKGSFRNRTVYTTHGPSSGPILLSLLNTIECFPNWIEEGKTALNVHRFVEAQKFAFAHRTEFGDPAFVKNKEGWEQVVTKQFAQQTYQRITDNATHHLPYYQAKFDIVQDHGTTHLSVVDSDGMAVSLTSTINLIFGSQVMDVDTGVIMNDELNDFATPGKPDAFGLAPSPFNYPHAPLKEGGPGKRPLSSTSAAILDHEDGSFWLAIGGSGGSRIFGGIAQVILNLDWGYDLSHAVEEPRVHDQLLPAYVSIESGIRPEFVDGLESRGHNISLFDINIALNEIQAVGRTQDGWFIGASDSRKNGKPAAY